MVVITYLLKRLSFFNHSLICFEDSFISSLSDCSSIGVNIRDPGDLISLGVFEVLCGFMILSLIIVIRCSYGFGDVDNNTF